MSSAMSVGRLPAVSTPPASADAPVSGDDFGRVLAATLDGSGARSTAAGSGAACGSAATTAGPDGHAVPGSAGEAADENPDGGVGADGQQDAADGSGTAAAEGLPLTLPATVQVRATSTPDGGKQPAAATGTGAATTRTEIVSGADTVADTVGAEAGAATDGARKGAADGSGRVADGPGAATGLLGQTDPAAGVAPGGQPDGAAQRADGPALRGPDAAAPTVGHQPVSTVDGHGLNVSGAGSTGATAAPAQSAQTPQPVAAQVFPAVVARLVTRDEGTQRLTIRLHPEELGEVRVVVTVRHGAVSVDLAAGSAAQEALRHGSGDLRRLLDGVGAASAQVVVRDLPQTGTQPVSAGTGATGPQVDGGNAGTGGQGRGPGAGAGAGADAGTGNGRGGTGPAAARAAPSEPHLSQPTSSTAAGAYRGPGVDLRM